MKCFAEIFVNKGGRRRPPRGGRGLKSGNVDILTLKQLLSPSSRRAWIEIPRAFEMPTVASVALLAEGVD